MILSFFSHFKSEAQGVLDGSGLAAEKIILPSTPISSGIPTDTPASPADGTGGDVIDNATPAPIDGGITLLLAAGIAYGAIKHRENKKKKTLQFE